jgi:hypothetical protein
MMFYTGYLGTLPDSDGRYAVTALTLPLGVAFAVPALHRAMAN